MVGENEWSTSGDPVVTKAEAPVIHLIGGPHVRVGNQCDAVPEGSKKLLAFVALRRGRVERQFAAGVLWPYGNDLRAAGNLRSALWRLRRAGIDVINADKWSLGLAEDVAVDVHELAAWSSRLIHRVDEPGDLSASHVPEGACRLLPGWYDDWVILERERIRQRVLHALEALAARLSDIGRHAEAVDAALRAVGEEPLRESAQYALLSAHLAQGNQAEVRLAYAAFARLVRRELGVEPSQRVRALLASQGLTGIRGRVRGI